MGKRFKTLREAKSYLKQQGSHPSQTIYSITQRNKKYNQMAKRRGWGKLNADPVYKYFVGTDIEWLNL